jgi:hypothetical protein
MAILEDNGDKLRKLIVPTAASIAGAGVGLVLTRKQKLRDSLPSLDDLGFGDLADDLRSKVSSMAGNSKPQAVAHVDADELEQRRREREQRRSARRART